MTPSHQSPQELAGKEASAREMINERLELKRREREVLNVVVTWSLARGREWAVVESLDDLAILCGLLRPHVSRTLLDLEEKRLLQTIRQRGCVRLRFLSSGGDFVEPPQRVDPRQIAAIAERMARLNSVPAGFDLGGQKLLPLETADETLANQMAEMSRERAEEMTAASYQIGTNETSANTLRTDLVRELGTKSVRATAAPAGTRAQHVHVPTSVPQSMLHVHEHVRSGAADPESPLRVLKLRQLEERLDEESQYWAGRLSEIFGEPSASKFRRTWLLRFCDRWQTAAFRAIGEVKRMQLTGERFKKGPGECANDLFNRFKHEVKTEVLKS